jgi:hypothetical protein
MKYVARIFRSLNTGSIHLATKRTRQPMYVERSVMARSPNHSCNGNATTHTVRTVELHNTGNNIIMPSVAQQRYYGESMYVAGNNTVQ